MKVFISWSKPRSKQIAVALKRFLEDTIQALDPWVSIDIAKGTRWTSEIAAQLAASPVGIVVVTPENQHEQWLNFEAGAISNIPNGRPCTFVVGLSIAEVHQPLSQFNATAATLDDVFRLAADINRIVADRGERALASDRLEEIVRRNWPQLEATINATMSAAMPSAPREPTETERKLDEVLLAVRGMDRLVNRLPDMISGALGPKVSPSSFVISPKKYHKFTPTKGNLVSAMKTLLAMNENELKTFLSQIEHIQKIEHTATGRRPAEVLGEDNEDK